MSGAALPDGRPEHWAVPAFKAQAFQPRRSSYAVVIPVINEGDRIAAQLAEMQAQGLLEAFDTILADGGSTDGSTGPQALRQLGLRALLIKTGPGKLSAQLRMAYAWALQEGYAGIITIDGNNKDSVSDIPAFAQALEAGADYVQASRFRRGGQAENTPLLRLLAIRLVHAPVLSAAAGQWLTDTTQGYRAYSARYLLDPRVAPFRPVFQDYELLAYLTVRASQLGFRVRELPTRRSYPKNEPVPTKIAGLRGNLALLRTLWRTVTRRYHPKQ
ncbi:glycosyltransferase family 2 protein (plasmid) [Roseobacteraceae bacterium NS-SX3]